MSEDHEQHALIDDDPALDFILYKEMEKDEQRDPQNRKGGCLSMILFAILLPASILYFKNWFF